MFALDSAKSSVSEEMRYLQMWIMIRFSLNSKLSSVLSYITYIVFTLEFVCTKCFIFSFFVMSSWEKYSSWFCENILN